MEGFFSSLKNGNTSVSGAVPIGFCYSISLSYIVQKCKTINKYDIHILQVTQLEELLAVRHSVFVVGGPGTGKSQVSYCLATAIISVKPHTCHMFSGPLFITGPIIKTHKLAAIILLTLVFLIILSLGLSTVIITV